MIENLTFRSGHVPGDADLAEFKAQDGNSTPSEDAVDNVLDSDECQALYRKLDDWYREEIEAQRENRLQMAMDADYYDGLQISAEDRAILEERGQAPLVFNRIALAINFITGSEVKTRFDWSVKPRASDDIEIAPIKTELLKYIGDANRAGTKRSAAFKDAVVAGVGWLESGITTDPSQELIYNRAESWRNVIHDRHDTTNDLGASRYLFRHRDVDVEIGKAMFPSRADKVEAASNAWDSEEMLGPTWYFGEELRTELTENAAGSTTRYHSSGTWSTGRGARRMRVRLVECWYRMPQVRTILRGEFADGEDYNQGDPSHLAAVENGLSSLVDHLGMKMHFAIFCQGALLHMGEMPYRHNRFPLIPVWCYRRDRDNLPYGMVRQMRDPQDDYNRRMSKALYLLSSNRVKFEDGAFDDEDEAREEAARPDAFLKYRRGHQVTFEPALELFPGQLALADRDLQHIEATSGITNEMMGLETNAVSGRAINARQLQGAITTAAIFDRYREAFELQGEINLALMEQYYTAPKMFRITGTRTGQQAQFQGINQRDPNDPMAFKNDITRGRCDFIVDEQDWRANQREALFDQIMTLLAKLPPPLIPMYLDLAFDLLDIPQGKEMAKRARMVSGMDSPEGPKTAEEAQASAQRKQMAQFQQMIAMRTAVAQAVKLEAEAQKIGNAAILANAQSVREAMTTMYEAMQAGQIVAAMPAVAPIADELLGSVGFADKNALQIQVPPPGALAPQPQQGGAPQLPAPPQPDDGGPPPQPEPAQAGGAMTGIETPAADGVRQ